MSTCQLWSSKNPLEDCVKSTWFTAVITKNNHSVCSYTCNTVCNTEDINELLLWSTSSSFLCRIATVHEIKHSP